MANVIVVGVGGTDPDQVAARRAAELASALGAALHVVVAFHHHENAMAVESGGRPLSFSLAEESTQIADKVVMSLRERVPTITSAAVEARPADALVQEASRLDASLIVVGNRRMQGVARVLGSVASAVAHHAPCDVYIVHTN